MADVLTKTGLVRDTTSRAKKESKLSRGLLGLEMKAMETPSWIKIGEHANRDVLKEMAKKIRSKWVGRYEFQICPVRDGKDGYELQLKHR